MKSININSQDERKTMKRSYSKFVEFRLSTRNRSKNRTKKTIIIKNRSPQSYLFEEEAQNLDVRTDNLTISMKEREKLFNDFQKMLVENLIKAVDNLQILKQMPTSSSSPANPKLIK